MKKLTILLTAVALVCFGVPALAVDWNFYGSARVNTWYVSTDCEDNLCANGTDTKDDEVRWGMNGQQNSRTVCPFSVSAPRTRIGGFLPHGARSRDGHVARRSCPAPSAVPPTRIPWHAPLRQRQVVGAVPRLVKVVL